MLLRLNHVVLKDIQSVASLKEKYQVASDWISINRTTKQEKFLLESVQVRSRDIKLRLVKVKPLSCRLKPLHCRSHQEPIASRNPSVSWVCICWRWIQSLKTCENMGFPLHYCGTVPRDLKLEFL